MEKHMSSLSSFLSQRWSSSSAVEGVTYHLDLQINNILGRRGTIAVLKLAAWIHTRAKEKYLCFTNGHMYCKHDTFMFHLNTLYRSALNVNLDTATPNYSILHSLHRSLSSVWEHKCTYHRCTALSSVRSTEYDSQEYNRFFHNMFTVVSVLFMFDDWYFQCFFLLSIRLTYVVWDDAIQYLYKKVTKIINCIVTL